jgi:hypothetical protein
LQVRSKYLNIRSISFCPASYLGTVPHKQRAYFICIKRLYEQQTNYKSGLSAKVFLLTLIFQLPYDGNPSHCGLMKCSIAQSTVLPTFGGKKLLRSVDLVLCDSHEPIYTVSRLTILLKYIHLQVKVKVTLEQATKVQKGSRGIAVLFL